MKYFCKSRNKQKFVMADLSLLFQSLEVLHSANLMVANSWISSDIKGIVPPQRYLAISQSLFSFGMLSLPPCERKIIFFSSGDSSLFFSKEYNLRKNFQWTWIKQTYSVPPLHQHFPTWSAWSTWLPFMKDKKTAFVNNMRAVDVIYIVSSKVLGIIYHNIPVFILGQWMVGEGVKCCLDS